MPKKFSKAAFIVRSAEAKNRGGNIPDASAERARLAEKCKQQIKEDRMRVLMGKTKTVLELFDSSDVDATYTSDEHSLVLDINTVESIGFPKTITLTIQPGDLLN